VVDPAGSGRQAAAEIEGRSLLERAVAAVALVATDVLVVCAPDDDGG
jgi:hypothetical protein